AVRLIFTRSVGVVSPSGATMSFRIVSVPEYRLPSSAKVAFPTAGPSRVDESNSSQFALSEPAVQLLFVQAY
ncbi:MAG: hypothetical protein ACKPBU_09525, partial [Alphaproteobacteria bacterium]